MSEAKALRALADKLDELDSLKQFPSEISDPGELSVNWAEGKDHDGYAALSEAISALVSQHWSALRSQVLKSKEAEVQAARNSWTAASSGNASAPAAPVDNAMPEPAIRRFG